MTATGLCPRCGSPNLYNVLACLQCGARLPWADAVAAAKQRPTGSNAPGVRSPSLNTGSFSGFIQGALFAARQMRQPTSHRLCVFCKSRPATIAFFQTETGFTSCAECAQRLDQEAEEERQAELAEILGGKLPAVPINDHTGKILLMLRNGESCHYRSLVGLLKEKTLGREYRGGSQGVSIRVAKGLSFRVGSSRGYSVPVTGVVKFDLGNFFITSERCVFDGKRTSFSIPHQKLLSFEAYENAIQLHPEGKKIIQTFEFFEQEAEMAAAVLSVILQRL